MENQAPTPESIRRQLSPGDQNWLKFGAIGAGILTAIALIVAFIGSRFMGEVGEYVGIIKLAALLPTLALKAPYSLESDIYFITASGNIAIAIPILTSILIGVLIFSVYRASKASVAATSVKELARNAAIFAAPLAAISLIAGILTSGSVTVEGIEVGSIGVNLFAQVVTAFLFGFLAAAVAQYLKAYRAGSPVPIRGINNWRESAGFVVTFFAILTVIFGGLLVVGAGIALAKGADLPMVVFSALNTAAAPVIALLPATLLGVSWAVTGVEQAESASVLSIGGLAFLVPLVTIALVLASGVLQALRRPISGKLDHLAGAKAAAIFAALTVVGSYLLSVNVGGYVSAGFLNEDADMRFGINTFAAVLVSAAVGYVLVVGGQFLAPYAVPRFTSAISFVLGKANTEIHPSWTTGASSVEVETVRVEEAQEGAVDEDVKE